MSYPSCQTVIILQARTGSSRFPGKVLEKINGIPMLSLCIRRLKKIRDDVPVITATTGHQEDDGIEDICLLENIGCFRGAENDVLERYCEASVRYNARYIIRATADNPLVDIFEGRRVLEEIESGKWDYVSMLGGNGLPMGAGLEAFTFTAIEKSWREGKLPHHREHVNEYILENSEMFNACFMKPLPENVCPELNLSVDRVEDKLFIENMLGEIGFSAVNVEIREIIKWWKLHSGRYLYA